MHCVLALISMRWDRSHSSGFFKSLSITLGKNGSLHLNRDFWIHLSEIKMLYNAFKFWATSSHNNTGEVSIRKFCFLMERWRNNFEWVDVDEILSPADNTQDAHQDLWKQMKWFWGALVEGKNWLHGNQNFLECMHDLLLQSLACAHSNYLPIVTNDSCFRWSSCTDETRMFLVLSEQQAEV